MFYKTKKRVKHLSEETKTVFHNLDLFVESAALINVAVMTYLGVTSKVDIAHLNTVGKYATVGSCVVIAFRGAWSFIKFLDNK